MQRFGYGRLIVRLVASAVAIGVSWIVLEYCPLTAIQGHYRNASERHLERSTITVPMRHSDLYFMLRYHLDRTRSRLIEARRDITFTQAS
jgi:hypothetical protein